MTIRICMILVGSLVLVGVGAAAGQLENSGSLRTGIETRGDVAFGDIALATDDSRRVVMAIDTNGEDGLADVMIVFQASEPVDGLEASRGYGLVHLSPESVKLTLPDLQETFYFSTGGEARVDDDGQMIGVRRFLKGQSLKTWTPQPGSQLALEEALQAESRPADPELRALSGGIFQKDTGSDSTGGCASSCSVTCHDGTSCSASCTSNECAQCRCPNATCGCVDAI